MGEWPITTQEYGGLIYLIEYFFVLINMGCTSSKSQLVNSRPPDYYRNLICSDTLELYPIINIKRSGHIIPCGVNFTYDKNGVPILNNNIHTIIPTKYTLNEHRVRGCLFTSYKMVFTPAQAEQIMTIYGNKSLFECLGRQTNYNLGFHNQ